MADSAVVNASLLILLARAGHIELLKMYLSQRVLDQALAKIGE